MKPKAEIVALLLGLTALHAPAFAQKPTPQQTMTVIVVNAHLQPSQPVQSLRVSLSYLDGASRITDAREVTNSHGQAFLQVSPDTAQRGDIRIEIAGANDLVIYQPADGQLSAVPPTVTIQLLPKGSPALLGPSQIEAMLHRSLLQVSSLQQQNRALKQEVTQQENHQQGLADALAQWAKDNGFALSDVDQHVQQWALEIQSRSAHATEDQKALADLALKNYASAAQHFEKAADVDVAGLDAEDEQFLKGKREKLRLLLNDARQGAGAFQFNMQFHSATLALERARDRAATEHQHFPDDAGIRAIWLQSIQSTAGARTLEGTVSPASQSLPLLAQSVSDYQSLAPEFLASNDKQGWANTQNNLGRALCAEGIRAAGDKAMALLSQAAVAYQNAEEFYTRTDHPKQWALTQSNLGQVWVTQGRSASGDQSVKFLEQAVQANQNALEIYTKAATPEEWAELQSFLGYDLFAESQHKPGDKAASLLNQSLRAEQSALEILTRTDHPRNWAEAQDTLGLAYLNQGEHATGSNALNLFDHAVEAFHKALEVYTRSDLPQQWANTENNLGLALHDEAQGHAAGERGRALLEQSAQAFEHTLEVYTQADLPQQWARAQNNLGQVYVFEGRIASGDRAIALFDQAAHAFQNALQVYSRTDLPQPWASNQLNLGLVYLSEGRIAPEGKGMALLKQAVQAFQSALEVYTDANFPQQWAIVQNDLGAALNREAEVAPADQAPALLLQSIDAFNQSLRVETKAELPQQWARTQSNLGLAHTAQGNYDAAVVDYQNALAADPHSANLHMTLVGANLRAGHFDACIQQIATVNDADLTAPTILLRESFRISCQWGAGDKTSALQTVKSLAARPPLTASLLASGWNSYGMLHYLAASPTFTAGRASWLALFTALQAGDGPAMTAALHQLEPLMQN